MAFVFPINDEVDPFESDLGAARGIEMLVGIDAPFRWTRAELRGDGGAHRLQLRLPPVLDVGGRGGPELVHVPARVEAGGPTVPVGLGTGTATVAVGRYSAKDSRRAAVGPGVA